MYGDYIYQGCYVDPGILLADRALNGKSANYGVGSIELCGQFCQDFQYFGLENGNECGYFRDIQTFTLLTGSQAIAVMRSRTSLIKQIAKMGVYWTDE
jgi:hypothetical protein